MNFEYACFISYRHLGGDMKSFINKFCSRLDEKLSLELEGDQRLFLDVERMKPGYVLDENIKQALCKCCCMIVIYTRSYLSANHPYCARELSAMLKLEAKRRQILERADVGLIIPVILSGKEEEIPRVLRENRIYSTDFLQFTRLGFRNLTASQRRKFEEATHIIADRVRECLNDLKDYENDDSVDFSLPSADDESVKILMEEGYLDFEDKKDQFIN
ncbi:MAG: toll/interleukin-1 receptor domain-containing protein [Bacteroidota bacterium]